MAGAPHGTIDFETRSAADLTRQGAYVYSRHASTQVLCLAFRLPGATTRLWHRAHPRAAVEQSPFPEDLADWVASGGMLEAHNSGFEYYVWRHALRREFPEFPELPQSQLLCSAAKASQYALPRSLADVCRVLDLPVQKDEDGKRHMMRVSRLPRPFTGADLALIESGMATASDLPWNEDATDLKITWAYCMNDVESEVGLSGSLGEMSEKQLRLWRMDQRMNERGISCDVEGARMAVDLAHRATDDINARIREITGGAVPKGSSRVKLKAWLHGRGVPALNTQADYLEELLGKLDRETREPVEEAVRLAIDVNRTSTSKYKQMLEMASPDRRLRDMMLYYGAPRSGRWSGKGVQPHNFLRGFKKEMESAWRIIRMAHELGDTEVLDVVFGSAMGALAKATRGALVASEGRDLYVADYAAIEARVLLWLAEDHAGLDIFRSGADIYLKMAADIYEADRSKADFNGWMEKLRLTPTDRALLKTVKDMFPDERQMGKVSILGLGFNMGAEKFDDERAAEGINLPRKFYKHVVDTYREKSFPLVTSLWSDTETAALCALEYPGTRFDCRMVAYKKIGRFLNCQLPSGKRLRYMDPAVAVRKTYTWEAKSKQGKDATIRVTVRPDETLPHIWNRAVLVARSAEKTIADARQFEVQERPQITYMGQDQKTRQWTRMATYGGELVANNTQGTAADFMGEGMLRCDEHPDYDLLLSIHDELVAEADEGKGDVREFEELMAALPEWVSEDYPCPIGAEGWKGKRYHK